MRVISVINYKGGVGKTSLTANLGAELAWNNKRVLLLDLDAQASLTFSFIKPDVWEKKFSHSNTIKSWFDSLDSPEIADLVSLIHTPIRIKRALKGRGALDLICSHLGLINVDLELATKLGGATLAQAKKNFLNVHNRLASGLSSLSETTDYDLVLVDCPPNFNIVTKTAIVASDYILVPTRPDELSTLGIDYLMRSIGGLVKDYNEYAQLEQGQEVESIAPKVIGVVFTMIQEYGNQPIAAQRAFMRPLEARDDVHVLKSYVKRNDTLFADAPVYGVPVVLLGPNSDSHQSVVAGLEALAAEFTGILNI